jgi:hypothetical protein
MKASAYASRRFQDHASQIPTNLNAVYDWTRNKESQGTESELASLWKSLGMERCLDALRKIILRIYMGISCAGRCSRASCGTLDALVSTWGGVLRESFPRAKFIARVFSFCSKHNDTVAIAILKQLKIMISAF